MTYWYSCFAVSQCPYLKKRCQYRTEKAKEYLESVKDFDELVSPQSLFLHFLGPEPYIKVLKSLEVVRKSMCFFAFFFLPFFIFLFFIFYFFLVLLGMTTRFSKQKLVEA